MISERERHLMLMERVVLVMDIFNINCASHPIIEYDATLNRMAESLDASLCEFYAVLEDRLNK